MAEPLYRRALDIDEKAPGPDQLGLTRDLRNLAIILQEQVRVSDVPLRVKGAALVAFSAWVLLHSLACPSKSLSRAFRVHRLECLSEPYPLPGMFYLINGVSNASLYTSSSGSDRNAHLFCRLAPYTILEP